MLITEPKDNRNAKVPHAPALGALPGGPRASAAGRAWRREFCSAGGQGSTVSPPGVAGRGGSRGEGRGETAGGMPRQGPSQGRRAARIPLGPSGACGRRPSSRQHCQVAAFGAGAVGMGTPTPRLPPSAPALSPPLFTGEQSPRTSWQTHTERLAWGGEGRVGEKGEQNKGWGLTTSPRSCRPRAKVPLIQGHQHPRTVWRTRRLLSTHSLRTGSQRQSGRPGNEGQANGSRGQGSPGGCCLLRPRPPVPAPHPVRRHVPRGRGHLPEARPALRCLCYLNACFQACADLIHICATSWSGAWAERVTPKPPLTHHPGGLRAPL